MIVGRIRESKDDNFGFKADTEEYVDLVKAGAIDPAKVTRRALQNAASIAGLVLTTEALAAEIKEEEKSTAGGTIPDTSGMRGMYYRRYVLACACRITGSSVQRLLHWFPRLEIRPRQARFSDDLDAEDRARSNSGRRLYFSQCHAMLQ